jgi:hypothetical protein
MAREAGIFVANNVSMVVIVKDQLERFEALVRADEREAMVVAASTFGWAMKNEDPFEDAVREIADIRARGQA